VKTGAHDRGCLQELSIRAGNCKLDVAANAAGGPCISRSGSKVSAWVILNNKEFMIARHMESVVGLPAG
jgi:acetate kinase